MRLAKTRALIHNAHTLSHTHTPHTHTTHTCTLELANHECNVNWNIHKYTAYRSVSPESVASLDLTCSQSRSDL